MFPVITLFESSGPDRGLGMSDNVLSSLRFEVSREGNLLVFDVPLT